MLKTIAEQIPLEGVSPELAPEAWKQFFAERLWPGMSSEDAIRRPDWHTKVLRIEAWAAQRGVTFGEVTA